MTQNSCAHDPLPKEDDAWKARPPYAIQSPDQFGPVQWRGRCHCGQVTYVLNRDKPLDAKFCHCRGCQLMHGLMPPLSSPYPWLYSCINAGEADTDQGAPFQWAAIFEKSSVSFTKGVQGLGFYCSSNCSRQYEIPTKVSCTFCHTPIMDEGRNMCLLFPESIQVSPDDWQRFRSDFQVSCVYLFGLWALFERLF